MKPCKSEAAFAAVVMRLIPDAIRIESGTTTVGIPDIYYWNTWIELKNIKRVLSSNGNVVVPWRPGQQAFALKHFQCTGRHTYTMVRMSDCVLLIPMVKHFEHNIVTASDYTAYDSVKEAISGIRR